MKFFAETLTANISFDMIRVKGGTFKMGCTSDQSNSNEKPIHRVRLSTFYLSQFLVTQELWEAVMGNNPSYFKCESRPVENVSWEDIQVFLRKLNKMTGKVFSLPTEAQWEYAARAGKDYTYAGSDNLHEVGWYNGNSHQETKPVGLKKPNAWGLFDMSGNVFEWCQDWYDSGYYDTCKRKGTVSNPKGPNNGSRRVLRGGGWCSYSQICRRTDRYGDAPTSTFHDGGFRIALSV